MSSGMSILIFIGLGAVVFVIIEICQHIEDNIANAFRRKNKDNTKSEAKNLSDRYQNK